MDKKGHNESRRDFLKKVIRSSFLLSAGLFLGSKETFANVIGLGSGICSTSYSCAGGGGACSTSYDCAGQGSGGRGQCSTSYSCAGGGGACSTSYNCAGN